MGDRTSVTLYVPSALFAEAKKIVEEYDGKADEENVLPHPNIPENCAYFFFEEVNYGELHCLPHLVAAGIAYDSDWASGDEYESGSEHVRFTPDGELKNSAVYLSDVGVSLLELLENLEDHEKLKNIILEHKERTVPLPWDNQVEYGKLYRTIQLIAPTQHTPQ